MGHDPADALPGALDELLRQGVFAIACGYADANDAARLAENPIQKLLVLRVGSGYEIGPRMTGHSQRRRQNMVVMRPGAGVGRGITRLGKRSGAAYVR